MDAAADDGAALPRRRQGGRHQRADGSENQRGVERLGRRFVGATGPDSAEAAREILRCCVARIDRKPSDFEYLKLQG